MGTTPLLSSLRAAVVVAVVAASIAGCAPAPPADSPTEPRTLQLLIVLDGLRPDYVTPELMPRLDRLAREGVRFERHHSVFPTVTRVNASSIATGAYPERHGLLGNTVFFPRVDPDAALSAASRDHLLRIRETEGTLLDVPDLGSIFAAAGRTVLAVSAGSTGSAFLLNHRAGTEDGGGGGILHTEYSIPPDLHQQVVARLGPPPPAAMPNTGRNRWAVDGLLEVGLERLRPDLVMLWLSDPDHTTHELGIGDPVSERALQEVDAEVGRLLDELERRGRPVDVFVTSDHGFSTHDGGIDVDGALAPFRGETADGHPDLVVAGHAVHDLGGDPERVRRLAAALQTAPGVGAIFTAPATPGDPHGSVPGTLSFDAARWGHPRAGAILFSPDWSDDANERGWPGRSSLPGVAGHGTSGRWDIHATLIAAGPDLRKGVVSEWPSANVDLAPTLSRLAGVEPPPTMQGRVLEEALAGVPPRDQQPSEREIRVERETGGIRYTLTGHFTEVAGARYLDYTTVERTRLR